MELIVWKDSLNLGIKEIDEQHKKLVGLINKLFEAMSARKGKDVMQVVFSEMSNYIVVHFGAEEKYMKQFGYEDYEYHKQEHAYFIEKLNEMKLKFNSGQIGITLDVLNFLKDWLLKHIMGTDRKYVRLFASKGLV